MKRTFVDLTYYSFPFQDSEKILNTCYSTLGFLESIGKNFRTYFVVRTASTFDPVTRQSVHAFFFRGPALKKGQIPFRFHMFIKSLQPDYILVHGFGSAHYLMFLRMLCPKAKIVLQCNGFAPQPHGFKKLVYKVADFFIDGYLFTGIQNAAPWYEEGTLSRSKVFDVMEGSTHFKFDATQIRESKSYLWVGNLFALKDPLTVLRAFDAFLDNEPKAMLTMVYIETDLLDEIAALIATSEKLQSAVMLRGFMPHADLEQLYNQHQFFVSASHQEGSGYALVEAMACGCVPIVTDIPPHAYMTDDCGLLFSPGNDQKLLDCLLDSQKIKYAERQTQVLRQFERKLSFKAIAKRIEEIFYAL